MEESNSKLFQHQGLYIYVISRNAEENDEDLEIYLNEIPNATIQNMKDCKLI